MRILLVSPYFPPQNAAASTRTHAFARCWSSLGHDVTVLTTAKRLDQRGLERPAGGFEIIEIAYRVPRLLERLRGRAPRAGAGAPSKRSGRSWMQRLRERTGIFSSVRMPDMTDFWIAPALAWARAGGGRGEGGEKHWDLVVSSGGPYAAHLVARAIKRDDLARFWAADFRDLWTNNHVFGGLFPFTLMERMLERSCLREVDVVTTVSPPLAEWLTARTRAPVAVVYNGYESAAPLDSPPAPASAPARSTAPAPAPGVRRLVYTGSIYPHGQDPRPLLLALAEISQHDVDADAKVRLVIAGPSAPAWLEMARSIGVERFIDDAGQLPRQQAVQLHRQAAALILLDWNDPKAGVLTGKLFEYLPAAAPILAVGGSALSPVAEVLRRTGRGLHFDSDVPRLAQALKDILSGRGSLGLSPNQSEIALFSIDRQATRCLALIGRAIPGLC